MATKTEPSTLDIISRLSAKIDSMPLNKKHLLLMFFFVVNYAAFLVVLFN